MTPANSRRTGLLVLARKTQSFTLHSWRQPKRGAKTKPFRGRSSTRELSVLSHRSHVRWESIDEDGDLPLRSRGSAEIYPALDAVVHLADAFRYETDRVSDETPQDNRVNRTVKLWQGVENNLGERSGGAGIGRRKLYAKRQSVVD